jgi:Type I restriction modification DNA specificity domain
MTKWSQLNSVAELLGGYPFRSAVRSEPGGEIAVVQLQDLATPGVSLPASVPCVSNESGRYERYLLRVGDVLFQARGWAHPAATVAADIPAISSPGLYVLRPRAELVLADYLAWCINHPKIQAAIGKVAQGTHAPFVAKQSLGLLEIPLPPLSVQHRIAEADRCRANDRLLTAALLKARETVVDGVTWEAAVGSKP